jgi:aminoglycoside 3-N-acetyltransferase
MAEGQIVGRTPEPRDRETLAGDLRRLGLHEGMIVIAHSSLSALGWVNGGPVAVVQALMDVLTAEGTLVMPAHTGLSDPATWENPPVPCAWWEAIRNTMPAYEPSITPTREMGVIAESFRTWPGVIRSAHPRVSFSAWGKHAARIISKHSLDNSLGEGSPLARIYQLDGWVLLMGVSYDNNTSFHLAEYRIPARKELSMGAPVMKAQERVWAVYEDIDLDSDVFQTIGTAFDARHDVLRGKIGSGESRLFRQREAVDFALEWLTQHAKDESD